MQIAGGVINSSVESVERIIIDKNDSALLTLVKQQLDAGVDRLDINCGTLVDTEAEDMVWMVKTIQAFYEIPLSIDSPSYETQLAALKAHRYGRPFINSATVEADRLDSFISLAETYDAELCILLHDEEGMPENLEDRIRVIPAMDAAVSASSLKKEDVYLDPLLFPISVSTENAKAFLETLKYIQREWPAYRTLCGLNNISYGLPVETILDWTFLAVCMGAGLDIANLDVYEELQGAIQALKTLNGEDEYCLDYLKRYREGQFEYISRTETAGFVKN